MPYLSDDFSLSIERCEDCSAWGASLNAYKITDLDKGDFYDFEMYIEIPDCWNFGTQTTVSRVKQDIRDLNHRVAKYSNLCMILAGRLPESSSYDN